MAALASLEIGGWQMRKIIAIACSVIPSVAVLTATVAATSRGSEPDLLCQMLFDEYVVGRGKVNGPTRTAATHIVAERGRGCGFWRNVLEELRKDDERTEMGCVRVLGEMLEIDALARDVLSSGKPGAWRPSIELGSEVVQELIARGGKADRFRVIHFAVALARARVPEANALLRSLLEDDEGKNHMAGAQFHAALGLAQCGDPAGYRWLIDHASDRTDTVSNAKPEHAASLSLDVCCIAALQDLSGQSTLNRQEDFEAWWRLTGEAAPPHGLVRLVEP
jgi:hypothetical protein